METEPGPWLAALEGSHRRLAALVETLDGPALRRPAYPAEWTVAQVLSHLGSGAEIFQMTLDAVLAGGEPPSRDSFPAVWDRWNAMSPEEQAGGFVAADGRAMATLRGGADRLPDLRLTMFGSMTLDGTAFAGMRLSEHAVHAWDVLVTFDPSARVSADAVELLIDRLPMMARFAGHPEGAGDERPFTARLVTSDPDRAFAVVVDDAVHLAEGEGDATGTAVHLPAEAALRLVYGRLDGDRRPPLDADELPVLDRLGRVFSGF